MGIPGAHMYGNADVGSAIEDVQTIIDKIKTNKFDKKDILKLYNANSELVKALLSNDYENQE